MEMRTGMGQVPGEAGLPSSKGAPQEGHRRGLTLDTMSCEIVFCLFVFILKMYLYVYIRHTHMGLLSLFRASTRNGGLCQTLLK